MAVVASFRPQNAIADAGSAELREIPIEKIDPNPDNPRVVFRQDELEQLLESVHLYGIQVPVSVYREGARYVLIDGERRWKVSLKLNRKTIPALIQEKPTQLENLLLMFNIHAMREQWDLLTVAMKLGRVVDLLTEQLGRTPTEAQIADRTGLPRAWIRRSRLLMEMPEEYRAQLLQELKKPKGQQKLSEDMFIEMERALRTVGREMPELVKEKDAVRRVLISKYRAGTIDSVVHFRKIGQIARARVVDADESEARSVLRKVFEPDNSYSITKAFNDSVGEAYLERDVGTRIDTLLKKLQQLAPEDVDEEMRNRLAELVRVATDLLESAE